MTDADKHILTLKRVEVGNHAVFVKEGEKPRIRVPMGKMVCVAPCQDREQVGYLRVV